MDIWKSWNEVGRLCEGRKVILFGRSEDWVPKSVLKLDYLDVECIVDSNPAYKGAVFNGLSVLPTERLLAGSKEDIYIIITAGPYESVVEQLMDMGFTPGEHFCCTPEMKDWGLLQEIREHNTKIIVACSDYMEKGEKRYSRWGGGIYVCDTLSNELTKKLSGHFRQMVRVGDQIYVVEYVEKLIYVLSKDLELVDKLPLEPPGAKTKEKPNACGIAYHEATDRIFVANAGSDTINVYDREGFTLVYTIHFSDRFLERGDGQHHINDITVAGDQLYVSYFSYSGNWKKGGMDGGVSEIDLNNTSAGPLRVFTGLWMPHSIEFLDGSLCVLNSMRGELYTGTQTVAGTFPGFARGLTFDGRFYYVGQSEDMYMSRLFGVSSNIMCNAGLYLFDSLTKVSRFYSFPYIMNVHDLLMLR